MQKFFIITAFILLSAAAATAQTTAEQKPLSDSKVEFATSAEADSSGRSPILSVKGRQTERIVDGRVLRVGPTTTYLKNGLSLEEVLKLMGRPATRSERLEAGRLLTVYAFPRSQGRVLIAQFENGLLTDSRMETTDALERERRDR